MSDKPRSTKPSSKMPSISSSKPASKMPKSEDDDAILPFAMFEDMSIAPQKSKISYSSRAPAREQEKKAKSTFAPIPEDDVLDEEYDDFEELTTLKLNYPELISPSKKPQSRVPSSSKYYDAKSSLTEKAKSVLPSAMFKDESKASKAKSMLQSAYFRDESKAMKGGTIMQSAYFKDESKVPEAIPILPSAIFSDESKFLPKSFMVSKEDKIMSTRQTEFTSLTPKEQKKQDEWAQEKIEEMGACPEQYKWIRKDEHGWGGYLCAEGRHGMTDQLIAEGQGGIIVLEKRNNLTAPMGGPWYPHPTIKNCYIYVERKEWIKGVTPYNQPAFLGSEHQRERAKWEFYSENFDDAVRMNYKWPAKEPPQEWADENNIPKTKAEREAAKE